MIKAITLDDIEMSIATIKEVEDVGKLENSQVAETHDGNGPTLAYSIESARKFFVSPSNIYFLARIKKSGRVVLGGGLVFWMCPYFYRRC